MGIKLNFILYFIFSIVFGCQKLNAQSLKEKELDSLKFLTKSKNLENEQYQYVYLKISDLYMDSNMFDSAQVWLNKLAKILPRNKLNLFNVYYFINQAETYYYNGLLQMGLQESKKALKQSLRLKDSLCITTCYNFMGVFYINMDSLPQSLKCLKESIKYSKLPPYPAHYLTVSKPHNIYGNLAEVYMKMDSLNLSKENGRKSLNLAENLGSIRGELEAMNILGDISIKEGKYTQAIEYHSKVIEMGLKAEKWDLSLISYGSLARTKYFLNDVATAENLISSGLQLMKNKSNINSFFKKQFLNDAILLFKLTKNVQRLSDVAQLKSELLDDLIANYDHQVYSLVQDGIENENFATNSELKQIKSKQSLIYSQLIFAILVLIGSTILIFVYRFYYKKEKEESAIRDNMSRDLHDDIGSTLSGILLYSELAGKYIDDKPSDGKILIANIGNQTNQLLTRISDVIWSLKPINLPNNSIINQLKYYEHELLKSGEINFIISVDDEIEHKCKNPMIRKNMLMVLKEAMNNVAKYSKANKCTVEMTLKKNEISLIIADDGIGFDQETIKTGNGLINMEKRIKIINGSYKLETRPGKGTKIIFKFSVN